MATKLEIKDFKGLENDLILSDLAEFCRVFYDSIAKPVSNKS
jgi:hypothetical protein